MLCRCEHVEVGNVVVSGIAVLVMNDFARVKEAADVLLDYEPMFHDVALAVGVRMMRCQERVVAATQAVLNAVMTSHPWARTLCSYAARQRAVDLPALASADAVRAA